MAHRKHFSRPGDFHHGGNFWGFINVEYWSNTGGSCATNFKKAVKIGRNWVRLGKQETAYNKLKCRLRSGDYDYEFVHHGNK